MSLSTEVQELLNHSGYFEYYTEFLPLNVALQEKHLPTTAKYVPPREDNVTPPHAVDACFGALIVLVSAVKALRFLSISSVNIK